MLRAGETDQNIDVRIYDSKTSYKQKKIEKAVFEYIRRNGYCIPLRTGIESIPIVMYLEQLPSMLDYCAECGLSFTRELDETRFQEKLTDNGRIEFAKGYMVDRYSFYGDGLFINEEIVSPPASAFCHKLVWRDVSRDSQLRRIKATLLPPGFICGNSLGVIFCQEENLARMKMLLVIMNSLIFEYQARSMLVSNHVAAGIVKQIHVPIPDVDAKVIDMVDRQIKGENLELSLELIAAKLYGIAPSDYQAIVESFTLNQEERDYLIQTYKEEANQNGEHNNMIFNHYASTLSDLDMQVIRCVPPGGNWKDIPESVPSQRLAQIRESYKAGKGSRSTYYGRLRPEMPAYTINTYFKVK